MSTSITDAAALEMLDALKCPRRKEQLMSDPINDGGPVSPTLSLEPNIITPSGGLSLRDYFAGQALAGLCADAHRLSSVVKFSYEVADMMIAARKEGRP
jgi:hypothetical protein